MRNRVLCVRGSRVHMHRRIARRVRGRIQVDGARIIDFGCGEGHLSQCLGEWTRQIVGVDIDEVAVARYNEFMELHGIDRDEMRAVVTSQLNELRGFDGIVASLVFHHIMDVVLELKQLRHCLHPDGWIVIVEVERHSNAQIHPGALIPHPLGFESLQLQHALEDAGFIGITIDAVDKITLNSGVKTSLLLATAKNST